MGGRGEAGKPTAKSNRGRRDRRGEERRGEERIGSGRVGSGRVGEGHSLGAHGRVRLHGVKRYSLACLMSSVVRDSQTTVTSMRLNHILREVLDSNNRYSLAELMVEERVSRKRKKEGVHGDEGEKEERMKFISMSLVFNSL